MITTIQGLRYGQLVTSLAGRDRQRYYLIVNWADNKFLFLVDGKKHFLVRPKKKNLKHVKITMAVALEIETAFNSGTKVTDTQIAAAISRLKDQLEEGDRLNG